MKNRLKFYGKEWLVREGRDCQCVLFVLIIFFLVLISHEIRRFLHCSPQIFLHCVIQFKSNLHIKKKMQKEKRKFPSEEKRGKGQTFLPQPLFICSPFSGICDFSLTEEEKRALEFVLEKEEIKKKFFSNYESCKKECHFIPTELKTHIQSFVGIEPFLPKVSKQIFPFPKFSIEQIKKLLELVLGTHVEEVKDEGT